VPLPEARYPALRLTPQQQKQQTYDALVAWTLEMLAARAAGRAPHWWLAGLMVIWANLHGSFVFGFVLAAGCLSYPKRAPSAWPRLYCAATKHPRRGWSRAKYKKRWAYQLLPFRTIWKSSSK